MGACQCGRAVIGLQSVQQGAQNISLGDDNVKDEKGVGDFVSSTCLSPVW